MAQLFSLGRMTTERISKWEPVAGIDCPCADISFAYRGPDTVSVTMHFSRVIGGLPRDLLLTFHGAISMRWESECFGLIPLSDARPFCGGEWSRWSYPLLRVDPSAWLDTHEARHPVATKGRTHFALIAMNDLFHILALPHVDAVWLEVSNAA